MYLAGLDVGTTGCKAAIFDESGFLISTAGREYAVDIPQPNWVEQDAELLWRLVQGALREAISKASIRTLASVGLSVQGEAVMPVDEKGRAIRPAILGMDSRTSEQNAWLRQRFGARHLFKRTGMPIHTVNTLPKLLWLKQYEQEVWACADRFLLFEDFLINKMAGQAVISRCLASRTQIFDLLDDRWSPEILEALELEPNRLATVKPSGTAVDSMKSDLAKSLGLTNTPLVVTGGHDQACGALGVGLVRAGLAMDSTGTAEVVEVGLDAPVLNETLYQGDISVYAHVIPDLYLAMALNHSGGLVLRWFRDTFGQEEMQEAQAGDSDAYDLLLRDASPDPTSLLLLPDFAGSGTPAFDTGSKGAILGLTFSTEKSELAKAILEGLTFELRLNLDLLKDGGIEIDELRAIGGGARSNLWLQLKADICGVPVVVPAITEAASRGAALLAGAAAGHFSSAAEAAEKKLLFGRRFDPDLKRKALYDERFDLYREVYPALKSIHHRM
ncbi:MAG TPA: FGGY-family carbohydrate kinase [candidate division Zixibacteria bacterium]|nr:FGGY-family carbohydrate kinase [candidate division Zixibacteria bacterium]